MSTRKPVNTKPTSPALPTGIIASDMVYPKKNAWELLASYPNDRFDMWYTERFGWCIPTLEIKRASSRARSRGVATDRTYAIRVSTGELVRIGHGPHVTSTVTVYVKKSRLDKLQRFLDLRQQGQADAGDARDQRSSRALQSRERRSMWGF